MPIPAAETDTTTINGVLHRGKQTGAGVWHWEAMGNVVKATGTSATDVAILTAACASHDEVLIDDADSPLVLASGTQIACGDTLIRGMNGMANIQLSNQTQLQFGTYLNAAVHGTWDNCTLANNNRDLTSAGLSGVVEGDLLLVVSEDLISGLQPHNAGGDQRPMEWAVVEEVNGTTYLLMTPLVDSYTVTPKVYHFPRDGSAGSGVSLAIKTGIIDIDFDGSNNFDAGDNWTAIMVDNAFQAKFKNVRLSNCGSLFIRNGYQCILEDIRCDGQVDGDEDYALALIGDEHVVRRYVGRDARHHFTTSGYQNGSTRYGTCRRIRIEDSVAYCTASEETGTGTNIAWDTHAEGYEILFSRVSCYAGGPMYNASNARTIAFNTRSRKTRFENCQVLGDKDRMTRGFRILCDDAELVDCVVDGAWAGVVVEPLRSTGPTSNRCTITGGIYRNLRNEALIVENGDDCVIDGALIETYGQGNGGTAGLFGSAFAAVAFDHEQYPAQGAPTGCVVRNCTIPYDATAARTFDFGASIDVDEILLENNVFDGYTRTAIGLDRTDSRAAELERRWTWKNKRPNYRYVARAAHGLVIGDDEFKPVNDDAAIHTGLDGGGDFSGVLVDVIDANNYVIAQGGSRVIMPATKVTSIASYDPVANGSYLRFSALGNGYSVAGDGAGPWILETDTIDSDNLTALVLTRSEGDAGGAGGGSGTEFSDALFRIQDDGDATKEIAFQASGITTGTTRTITMPDADVNLADAASTTFPDDTFRIQDNADNTKEIAFEASAITTATTRTITMPDANVDLSDWPEFQDTTFAVIDGGDLTKKIAFQASEITTATTRTITMPDADVDLDGVNTATMFVATKAALATATPADEQAVMLMGYTTAGDGGGQMLRYDSGSAATIDDGFVFDGPGSVGRYIAVDQSFASAKRFGATGDGTTDDRARLQAALDAGADTIRIESGTYIVTITPAQPYCLKLSDGQTILGEGIGNTIIKLQDSSATTNSRLMSMTAAIDDLHIEGITFDGNRANWAGAGGEEQSAGVFVFAASTNIRLMNCEFKGCKGDGCRVSGTNILVQNCRASDNYRVAINVHISADLRVINNVITDTDIAIKSELNSSDVDAAMVNQVYSNNQISAQQGIVFNRAGAINCYYRNVTIDSNQLHTNTSTTSGASGTFQEGTAKRALFLRGIKGGVISNNSFDHGADAGFMQIASENHDVSIVGNSMVNMDQDLGSHSIEAAVNIGRWTTGGQNRNITFCNNVIDNCKVAVAVQTPTNAKTGTVTVNDTTDVWSLTNHGIENEDIVTFTTTGTLPTASGGDITAGVEYFVRDVDSGGDTFKIARTQNGTAIDITNTGSGTHTVTQKGYAENITINNNVMTEVCGTGLASLYAIHIRDAERVVMDGNVIKYAEEATGNKRAIFLQNLLRSPTHIKISNNIFHFPAAYGSFALDLEGATDVQLVGNYNMNENEWFNKSTGAAEAPSGKFLCHSNYPPVRERTFADLDATPSVQGYEKWKATNTGATSITTFDDGVDGQLLEIIITNGNTTFVDGATLALNGNINWTPGASGGSLTLRLDGTIWREMARASYTT